MCKAARVFRAGFVGRFERLSEVCIWRRRYGLHDLPLHCTFRHALSEATKYVRARWVATRGPRRFRTIGGVFIPYATMASRNDVLTVKSLALRSAQHHVSLFSLDRNSLGR